MSNQTSLVTYPLAISPSYLVKWFSDSILMWGWGHYHTTTNSLGTPTGCPTHQLSSITIYLEIILDLTGWGFSPIRLPLTIPPPPLQMSVTWPTYLCFWPAGYKSEIPKTPFFGSINLPDWPTERRETFYSLNYHIIVKGYNSGWASWKRCVGQGAWEECGASMPSPGVWLSHISTCYINPASLNPVLLGFYGGFIT